MVTHMNFPLRRLGVIALMGVLVATASACDTNAPPGTPFTITGSVSNLTPGVQGSLLLTAHNSSSVPISVKSIQVDTDSAPAACPASNLTTTNFTGTLAVPANGTANQSVPISLVAGAPDSCQNVSFSLKYTGSAQYTQVFASHTVLTSSKAPSTVDEPVEFTATVDGGTSPAPPGPPTGSVTFYDGNAVLGSSNLDGAGKARFLTSHLTVGTHSIKATYNGEPNFTPSTSDVFSQEVKPHTK